MKLKPYPKYKESGIQWIGKVPENWQIDRLKFLLSTIESGGREEGGGANLEKGAFSLGGEHVNWDGTLNLENERFISEEYYNSMNKGKIKLGDILLVKDGATIGKTAILNKKPYEKMAVNEHVFLMRPNKKINSKLLYYLICGDSGFTQIKLTETGSAQGGINLEFPDIVLVTIPEELEEQEKLFSFLDSKTSQISQTIEKDWQLIDLLKEKRTALINHVVTKGLNPKAKMKDSGIEWIGEVPEGWEVKRLKRVCSFEYGSSLSEEERTEGNVYVYGSNGIVGTHNKSITKKPCIIVGRKGSYGKVNYSETLCFPIDTTYFIDERFTKNNIRWLFYSLQCLNLDKLSMDSAVPGLGREEAYENFLSVPTKPEQIQISSYLDKATSKIDQTIKKIEEKVELLEEYKKSLIHHVVTGKVDVRGQSHEQS